MPGTLARRRAEYHVAEVWLYHAIETGRRYRQWPAFVAAQIALGNLFAQRGEYDRARTVLERALRAAKRPAAKANVRGQQLRLRDMQRRALQDLMTVAADAGDYPGAEQHARAAFELMRTGHPRLPYFAHDVAVLWILRGHFDRAVTVLRALLPFFGAPLDRILVLANLTRSAGAMGEEALFQATWAEAWDILQQHHIREVPSWIPCSLARGAASLERWDMAASATFRARESAEARSEHDRLQEAAELMNIIRNHQRPEGEAEALAAREARDADTFADELRGTLEELAAKL